MSVDLQVVFPQEVVPLEGATLVRMKGLWVAAVVGEDFTQVEDVLINDMPAPEVFIIRSNRLLAQLPPSLQGPTRPLISSLSVLSHNLTFSSESLLRFKLNRTPGKARGLVRLVQLFFKLLLTTPGTDIFAPFLGGGLMQAIGKNFSKSTVGSSLVGDAVVSVATVARQVMGIQLKNSRIPRDERLLSASVLGSKFDPNTGTLYLQIQLQNQAGKLALMNLAA